MIAALLAAAALVNNPCEGARGPDCLFDAKAIADVSTLHLALDGEITHDGTITRVPFRYDGAPLLSGTWPHRATLFLPDSSDGASAAIYSEVTHAADGHGIPGVDFLMGRRSAELTGVPIAVIASLPPQPLTLHAEGIADLPRCLDVPIDERAFLDCANRLSFRTGDFRWSPFAQIASEYRRAIVALENLGPLLSKKRKFAPKKFATGGYSKRGMAQWLVAATETKVAAVWIGGGPFANLPAIERARIAQWGDPNGTRQLALAVYAVAQGKHYLAVSDAATFPERLKSTAITIFRGSDDEVFPFDEISTYRDTFPSIASIGFAGDARHVHRGHDFILDLPETQASWRGFVGSALGSAKPPAQIQAARDGRRIVVTVDSKTPPRLWWISGVDAIPEDEDAEFGPYPDWGKDDADLRDAAWSNVAMTSSAGHFVATLPANRPKHGAWFVDLLDANRFSSTAPARLDD